MEITRRDREALDELLGFFDDCKDLTEEHVNAMLVILAEHRQNSVAALEKERDGLREALQWWLTPDHLIGSLAEKKHKFTEKAQAALAALLQREEGDHGVH